MSWKWLSAALLWIGAAGAAAAQGAPRDLAIPADKSWQHAHTGMILPSRLAGLPRAGVRDFGTEELDVVGTYAAPEGVTASVYIYKSMIPDAPLWFDRADAAIRLRNPNAVAAGAPAPFAFPGAAAPSGLRTSYQVGSPGPRSTAVAVAPVSEGWLVKVRISASALDRAEIDEKLSAILAGLRWPKEESLSRAAAAIEPCASPLVTKKAKVVKPDMAQMLLDLTASTLVAEGKAEGPPPVYCREPGPPASNAVYRANGSEDSYVVALGDSGIALGVGPSLSIDGIGSGRKSYSLLRYGRNDTSALPSFNRLPPPEQAIATAMGGGGGGLSISTSKKKD